MPASAHAQAANFRSAVAQIKPALIGSDLGWGTVAVPSVTSCFAVASGEFDECGSQLFDGVSSSYPKQVLLSGSG